MSIQKQTVSVPLIDGISEQDDAFAHDPPGFIELAEVRWNRDKQMGKRFGVSDRTAKGGTRPLDPKSLVASNAIVDLDGVPHILSGDGTARRDPISGDWNALGAASPRAARLVSDPVVRVNDSAVKSDCAIAGSIACVVWEVVKSAVTLGGAYYQFFDVTEDVPRPLCAPTSFPSGITNSVRVVSLSGRYFVAVGLSASTGARFIKSCSYDTNANTYTFGATASIDSISGVGGSNLYALDPDASQASCFVSYLTGAGNWWVTKLDNTGATTAGPKALGAGGLGTPSQVLHNSAISKVVVIQTDGTVKHVADTLTGAVTAVTPFTSPASGTFAGTWLRAAIGLFTAAGKMVIARSTAAPVDLGTPAATQIALLSTGFVTTGENLLGGTTLAALCSQYHTRAKRTFLALTGGQAWKTVDSVGVIGIGYRAAPVMLIVEPVDPGGGAALQVATVARTGQDGLDLLANAEVADFDISASASHLPHVTFDSSAVAPVLHCAYPIRLADLLGGSSNNQSFKRGVDMARVEVVSTTPARNAAAQSLRVIGTSHGTSAIDGVTHAEMTPQGIEFLSFDGYDATLIGNTYTTAHIDVTGSPWGGGPNPNPQWAFSVVWRYTDQRGNIHRGPPSSICTSSLDQLRSGAGEGGKLVFHPWKPSALTGDVGQTPEVEVYACPFNGGGDYRLLGIVTPKADAAEEDRVYVGIVNGGNSDSYTVDLHRWDATDNPPRSLYTTEAGGLELPATPSPGLLSICSTQSRLWGLSAEDRLDVWYTKPIALGFAPEWSDTLRVRVPQDGGPAVAIAAIDDKVIVFKRSRIFMIEGEGGDASGNGSSLRTPRLISSDVGCDSVESVVEGPFGIVFHSQRGFMVLSRDLSYQFVGDKVIDQLTTDNGDDEPRRVVSACLVPAEAEVRFCLDATNRADAGGWLRGLVWNYRFGRWCRRDALAASFNALVGDAEWWMVDGVSGVGGSNLVYQETPRIWSSSTFGISCKTSWIKFNGIAGFARMRRATFVFRWYRGGIRILTAQDYRAATETARDWTEAELSALSTGIGGLVELVVHPLVQRCEAVQFQIVELGASGGAAESGRAFELVGVTLECGVYPGAFRKLGTGARK